MLQAEDLRVVYNALKEVSPHWRCFGLELFLPNYVLENIPSKQGLALEGNDAYFREMLSTWLQSDSGGEAKTVRKLKEALINILWPYVAGELLIRLNSGM